MIITEVKDPVLLLTVFSIRRTGCCAVKTTHRLVPRWGPVKSEGSNLRIGEV